MKSNFLVALQLFFLPFCTFAQTVEKNNFLKHSKTMEETWELGRENDKGLFLITAFKPVYFTAGRFSSNPNQKPTSENPLYTLPFKVNYNKYEAKFQFSFKTKVARRIFWGHGDIWVAYSQKAHWQIYNEKLSRPFRELNYEPEVLLNFSTNFSLLGFKTKMIGITFNHQSNGRTIPLSRSWNRVILQAGFERKNFQVLLRPWVRLKDGVDENPAITDYTGRAEAIVIYNKGRHQLSSVMAHSLKFKDGGRGSIQLNWIFPVINNLRGHVQLSEGYGETLQDYNHRQSTIGAGFSLVDW